jgi:hypothetical protein
MHKNIFSIFVLLLILTASCAKKQDASSTQEKAATVTQGDAGARDISTATLVSLDPEIQQYDDAVVSAKSKYDKGQNPANTAELLKAYIAFADYMQYESTVSPRQGKYHRALVEYKHALALEPGNEKVNNEIRQIEDIYRSMGRPIPGEESM